MNIPDLCAGLQDLLCDGIFVDLRISCSDHSPRCLSLKLRYFILKIQSIYLYFRRGNMHVFSIQYVGYFH
jgi:hypothetical protein